MRLFILVLVLAALPIAAAAADLSGKWTIDGDVVGNAVSLSCTFQQSGEGKIAGKCTVNGMEPTEIGGDVKDAEFKFSFNTAGYTLTYSGTIEGDAIKGNIAVAGVTGTFTGTRAK